LQNLRIDFQFDKAAFDFKKLPIKIPYPVPFKLLGDETKVAFRDTDLSLPRHESSLHMSSLSLTIPPSI